MAEIIVTFLTRANILCECLFADSLSVFVLSTNFVMFPKIVIARVFHGMSENGKQNDKFTSQKNTWPTALNLFSLSQSIPFISPNCRIKVIYHGLGEKWVALDIHGFLQKPMKPPKCLLANTNTISPQVYMPIFNFLWVWVCWLQIWQRRTIGSAHAVSYTVVVDLEYEWVQPN